MKVLLLAAGRSRRVKPIADKNFVKFFGKTLIEHQLDQLQKSGLKDILIVGGAHNINRLQEIAKKYKAKVFEQKNLDEGMAGAVSTIEKAVRNDDLFIVSSNDFVDVAAYKMMKKSAAGKGDSFLLAYETSNYFPGGYLKMKGQQVIGIVEKPGEGEEPSKWVNIVLHLHKNPGDLFAALKSVSNKNDDKYELALDQLMQKRDVRAVQYNGFWQPIKYPWHILDFMAHDFKSVKRKIHKSAKIAKTAVINGAVIIEEGVKIFDHAVIQGPAYIGKKTIIGNNALVRESMIGDNCVVGYNTEVARSFVGDDCWFHSNYIGDSVIGNDVSFGGGALCANLRLDEKNIGDSGRNKLGPILGDHIRIGVNTSLMPGVRIGSNTMITSGLIIAQDIDEGKFVSGKTELVITENRTKTDAASREKMKGKL